MERDPCGSKRRTRGMLLSNHPSHVGHGGDERTDVVKCAQIESQDTLKNISDFTLYIFDVLNKLNC